MGWEGRAVLILNLFPISRSCRQSTFLARTQGQGGSVQAPDAMSGHLEVEEAVQGQKEPR